MEDSYIDLDELKEGKLYKFEDGVLIEVQTDPDDTMKRIKIMESSFNRAVNLQCNMRKTMNGYRPDIHLVCSALIQYAAEQPNAMDVIRDFCLNLFE